MNALVTAISEKLGNKNPSITDIAKAVGVSMPTAKALLNGVGKPRKATRAKLKKYLAVEDADVENLVKDFGEKAGKKPARKMGRKPGRGAKAAASAEVEVSPFDIGKIVYDTLKPLSKEQQKQVLEIVTKFLAV